MYFAAIMSALVALIAARFAPWRTSRTVNLWAWVSIAVGLLLVAGYVLAVFSWTGETTLGVPFIRGWTLTTDAAGVDPTGNKVDLLVRDFGGSDVQQDGIWEYRHYSKAVLWAVFACASALLSTGLLLLSLRYLARARKAFLSAHVVIHAPNAAEVAIDRMLKDIVKCKKQSLLAPATGVRYLFPGGGRLDVHFCDAPSCATLPSTWIEFQTPEIDELVTNLEGAGMSKLANPHGVNGKEYFQLPGNVLFQIGKSGEAE